MLEKIWDFVVEHEEVMQSLLALSTSPKKLKEHALNYNGFGDGVVSAYPTLVLS